MRHFICLFVALGFALGLGHSISGQDENKISRADRGKIRDTKATLGKLASDLRTYTQIHDNYPDELKALVTSQLRESLPQDAWGRDFTYSRDAAKGFVLTSLGADGKAGGKDADADIVWTRDGEQRTLTDAQKAALEKQREELRFQAHGAVARKEMVVIGTQAVTWRRDKGAWPESAKGLRKEPATDDEKAIDRCFVDPWGHDYDLRLLAHDNFAVVCWGQDGKEGGSERDADFVITEKEVRSSYLQRARWDEWGGWRGNTDWRVNDLVESIRKFKKKVKRLPETLEELTRPGLTEDGAAIRPSLPKDRWGKDYVYVLYGPEEFFVVGLGKNQLEGGTGEDADTVAPEPGVVEREYEEWNPEPAEDQDALRAEIAREQARDIVDKVNEHKTAKGAWPESLESVKAKFAGEVVPLDPWGRSFVYALTKDDKGVATGFTVTCRGKDGAEGGTGTSADIVINQDKEDVGTEHGEDADPTDPG